ncbi:hypothetical protein PXD04_09400 [Methanosphaera sp. ISO3-F5]|uniref:hypothetical protein n=1 Tax=Methanosphaera sp. ISO3-F5 TaxID=1452353 RepID=UPI002B257055|nr:hypothetical protein [Methanosphaera sp. ISO3-F5]WQH63904.1 hypothetical protein PXD04_09400 [Methanosphaera sp. ISO3-F5]
MINHELDENKYYKINSQIIEEINNLEIDINLKDCLKEILLFEYDISNQYNPNFKKQYEKIINKYFEQGD